MFKFSHSTAHIDRLKDHHDDLDWEISSLSDLISELEEEIKNGEKEIKKLSDQLDTLKKKVEDKKSELLELNTKLPKKEEELEKLRKVIDEEEDHVKAIKRIEFQNYVLNMKKKGIFAFKLSNSTSTVNLLDEFCASKKDFLVLKDQFAAYNNTGYISLIITPRYQNIEVEHTQPTMTELKQNVGKQIHNISCPRLQPLLKEIDKINRENNPISKGSKFAFERPFLIGGQTSANRTGYGCEWIGGGDYITGTLYGEVTDFMVVGIIFEGYSWYY